jgi:AcrR family transcriptional regulator
MPAPDTKELILDAAERLIAEKGIDAVSLRAITKEANVNLAAVHYHFGSKEALVHKVFERRIAPINRQRLELLDNAEGRAGEGPLAVEDVRRALMAPALRLRDLPDGGALFMKLCGRIYAEPAGHMNAIFSELFAEVVKRFGAAFASALPELPAEERFWRAHFCIGAMVHTMLDTDRLRMFSRGLCDPSDTDAVIGRIVQFCAAGLRAGLPETSTSYAAADGRVAARTEARS